MNDESQVQFEVEQKFPVGDLPRLEATLAELGVRLDTPIRQTDRYFNHPQRDFAETDEAFRIRSVGEQNKVTYKGPKLETEAKTRREIEFSIQSGEDSAEQLADMLKILSFRSVATVAKYRRQGTLVFAETEVEVCLDEVDQIGNFVEIEILTDEAGIDAAVQILASLAKRLGLEQPQRKSYLQLLLEA